MDRQRRTANPDNYDTKGRIKKPGKKRLQWKSSKSYERTRRRKATRERKLAAHRKSLHGQIIHQIVAVGTTIIMEKLSYKAWQKQYGRSVGLRAPGMFVAMLRRTVASTGGTLIEVPTRTTRLSQFCHGCGKAVKKPLSQRWHACQCGIGPIQRDLYSAFLAAYLDADHPIPSCARYVVPWEAVCGEAAGRTRAGTTTGECGADLAPKHGCSPCRSPSAQQSEPTGTRASLPAAAGSLGSVEGPLRTPAALAQGAFRPGPQ